MGDQRAGSLCNVPETALAIATNTTAVNPTARTFITMYPSDVSNPGTLNLNVVAGAAPTPNSANIPLSAGGEFEVYNDAGSVNIIIDVNGYYQPSSAVGATGAPGAPGADGAPNRITNDQAGRRRCSALPIETSP